MNETEIKILETGISLILFFIIRFGIVKLINRTVAENLIHKTRAKIIRKILQIILITITLFFVLTIWGVEQSQMFVFMASVLTVIGIAFFAQWSHLSNLTSGIIIFFNHTVKLDDYVVIMDKEYDIEGKVSDIGLFFIRLKTKEGEDVTFPNNVFLQKMVKKKSHNQSK